MRDIKVNGEVRTVFYEPTPAFNGRGVRLVFASSGLNIATAKGVALGKGDIQEISGPPLKPDCFDEQWHGTAKLKSGQEVKVLCCLTALEGEEDFLISMERTEKQAFDYFMKLNLKAEEDRKELERKEAEDRALAVEREKAITEQEKEKTALIIAQTEAVKQPAAAAKQVIALKEKLARAEDASALTLKEALGKWMRFDPPGMGASTRAHIEKAVQLYITDPNKRSLSKIAAEFHVSRTTVSKWFNTFTKETGYAVANHRRNESVRERTFVDTAGPTTAKKSHSGWYDPEGEGSHPR